MQKQTYTVSQLTYKIKNLLEGQSYFQGFVLKGEISNFVRHRSGHLYFALKDENSQIRAIMFDGHAKGLLFNPKDGDKVTVVGNISVYGPQGTYAVQVTQMNLDGAGELYLKYLELKEKLKILGWFDKPKKGIPKYPRTIGVITSATGAVIQDITNTVNRRYRLTNILLYPALVQGPGSSESIAKQVERANQDAIADVLIVGRGGGSIEDLWGFNELLTISAIYNSKIPIITAIGHETDDTISDLVSDLRAPTPTAAAELATPNTIELFSNINEMYKQILFKTKNIINKHQTDLVYLTDRLEKSGPLQKLESYETKLNNLTKFLNNYYMQSIIHKSNQLNSLKLKVNIASPVNKLNTISTKINLLKENMTKSYNYVIERNKNQVLTYHNRFHNSYLNVLRSSDQKLTNLTENLKLVNPLNIMERGFAVTKNKEGVILSSVKKLKEQDLVEIIFKDGSVEAEVIKIKEKDLDGK